jgi:hypothetical protein
LATAAKTTKGDEPAIVQGRDIHGGRARAAFCGIDRLGHDCASVALSVRSARVLAV